MDLDELRRMKLVEKSEAERLGRKRQAAITKVEVVRAGNEEQELKALRMADERRKLEAEL